MTIRALVHQADNGLDAVAAHVASQQAAGRAVLLLTADKPSRTLLEAFRTRGVDTARLHILDVVSLMSGRAPGERPANTTFLPSPTMLEMMAMRVEQIAPRLQGAHVVVDSLDCLALYNGTTAVKEFSHYLANRLRTAAVPGDFIVNGQAHDRDLLDHVAAFTDGRLELRRPATNLPVQP